MSSNRFEKILNLLPKSQILADIGTDHAKLPILAVQQGLVKKAYAVDLREKPLKMAKKNIHQAGLENQIIPIQADGLTFLTSLKKVIINYCVISGLGSATIVEILKNDSHQIQNYLICANNQISELRKWANQKQYTIIHEDFLVEHQHQYWILSISKSKIFKPCKNEDFGDFHWYANNQNYQQYLINLIKYHQKIMNQIDDLVVKKEFEIKNQKIQEYLRLWN